MLPPIRPLTEGPSFPFALIMDVLQIMWFILVTGRVRVKLVKAVHLLQKHYVTGKKHVSDGSGARQRKC